MSGRTSVLLYTNQYTTPLDVLQGLASLVFGHCAIRGCACCKGWLLLFALRISQRHRWSAGEILSTIGSFHAQIYPWMVRVHRQTRVRAARPWLMLYYLQQKFTGAKCRTLLSQPVRTCHMTSGTAVASPRALRRGAALQLSWGHDGCDFRQQRSSCSATWLGQWPRGSGSFLSESFRPKAQTTIPQLCYL